MPCKCLETALPVPAKLRNAVNGLSKQLGHGKQYKYPHDFAGNYTPEDYLPTELGRRYYYEPSGQGLEGEISVRLKEWRSAREANKPKG